MSWEKGSCPSRKPGLEQTLPKQPQSTQRGGQLALELLSSRTAKVPCKPASVHIVLRLPQAAMGFLTGQRAFIQMHLSGLLRRYNKAAGISFPPLWRLKPNTKRWQVQCLVLHLG